MVVELMNLTFVPDHPCNKAISSNLYALQPLRNALRLMGAPASIVPDRFDGQLSYMVTNYLRKLKKQVSPL